MGDGTFFDAWLRCLLAKISFLAVLGGMVAGDLAEHGAALDKDLKVQNELSRPFLSKTAKCLEEGHAWVGVASLLGVVSLL